MKSSRYIYSCGNCGGEVEKLTPCHSEKNEEGHVTDYAGLHGWRCVKECSSGIKVKRVLK